MTLSSLACSPDRCYAGPRSPMRLYLDPSLFLALADGTDPNRRDVTAECFDRVLRHQGYVSTYTLSELEAVPLPRLSAESRDLLGAFPVLPGVGTGSVELARDYILAGIVDAVRAQDAIHISTAVAHGLDAVLSWTLHLQYVVRTASAAGMTAVNARHGFRSVLLLSPPELP